MTDISLSLHKHLRLWNIYTSMDVWHVMHQLEFSPVTPGFCILVLAQMDFFLAEVLFSLSHLCLQFVGASDIDQVSTAKNSIYSKYFYLLKIYIQNTFLLSERRSPWEISNMFSFSDNISRNVCFLRNIHPKDILYLTKLMLWGTASFFAVEISSQKLL